MAMSLTSPTWMTCKKASAVGAADFHLAHVVDIEQAGRRAHGVVLHGRAQVVVLHRHSQPGKGHDAAMQPQVLVVEGSAFEVFSHGMSPVTNRSQVPGTWTPCEASSGIAKCPAPEKRKSGTHKGRPAPIGFRSWLPKQPRRVCCPVDDRPSSSLAIR